MDKFNSMFSLGFGHLHAYSRSRRLRAATEGDLMQGSHSVDPSVILSRFNRLMRLFSDTSTQRRTVYEPWEVQLLTDIAQCRIDYRVPKRTFDAYRKAVQRQVELTEGTPGTPMLLSEYLSLRGGWRGTTPLQVVQELS